MPKLRIGGAEPGPSYQRMSLDVNDVIFVQKSLLNARKDFLAANDIATANKIALIFDDFVRRVRTAAERTAVLAEQEIVGRIEATRVRPDSGRPGAKLRDLIKAEAWDPTPSIATGAVAIGLHDELDKVPYWRAQEWGYQYRHTPKGVFMGAGFQGSFMPNPAMFRLHPLFMPNARGGRFKHPPRIAARRYLWWGTAKARIYWRAETSKAIAEATAQTNRLLARRGRGGRARRPSRRP